MTINEVLKLADVKREELERIRLSNKKKRATIFCHHSEGVIVKIWWNARKQLIRKEAIS